jgi:hypothetical protein
MENEIFAGVDRGHLYCSYYFHLSDYRSMINQIKREFIRVIRKYGVFQAYFRAKYKTTEFSHVESKDEFIYIVNAFLNQREIPSLA